MHHHCGVSRCDLTTQDVLCPTHRDALVAALKAIATGGVQRIRHHRDWNPATREYATREEVDYYPGLWEDLETTLTRQDKIGAGQVRVRGKGDSPAAFHERASTVKADVTRAVSHWAATFAVDNPHLQARTGTLPATCAWMASFPSLLATHPESPAMLSTFTALVRHITHVIDRAPDRVYLGICSAPTEEFPCAEDVWGLEGNDFAVCRSCGAQHDVQARQAALLEAVRHQDATPTEIDRSFAGYVGMKINASSIRTWARAGEIHPTGHTEDGYPRYNVGVVFDHAQTKATRIRKEAA
jgi:hypothetical protein